MPLHRWGLRSLAFVVVFAICGLALGQQEVSPTPQVVPPLSSLEPYHDFGQGVTGAFEGWYPNEDGTINLLMGYFNPNLDQTVDIPTGPNNRIEPGDPDQGQPTHFLPGRQWGLFTVTIPKPLGDKRLTWTIVSNGQTTVIPLNTLPLYRLEPLEDAEHNAPPFLSFSEGGPFVNGPKGPTVPMTAKVGVPLSLTAWAADDDKNPFPNRKLPTDKQDVQLEWIVYRSTGPGAVKFANNAPLIDELKVKAAPPGTPFQGKSTTTATFSAPGEYILNIQAQDTTGGGPAGRQCCWSNAKVKVSVTP
jgi:hypothetical protein